MRLAPRLVLFLAAPLLLAACDRLGGDDAICTTEAKAALAVQAFDADTRAALTSYHVTARDGEFSETQEAHDTFATRVNLATERPGRYVVTVEKPGYASWSQADIDVEADECHVQTAVVDAYLSPFGGNPSAR